jgi:hypothetical protein
MYRNSVDAFTQLLQTKQDASIPGVNNISSTKGCMKNGIVYCVVQVMCNCGEEYRIEAYGEEAEELYRTAREQSELLCLH